MPRRYAITAIAVLAVIAIVVATRGPAPPPPPVSESDTGEKAPPPAGPSVAPTGRSTLPHDITGLKPGEVRPGTTPDTIIVQPMQPGPPKEISKHYTVPTTEEDPRIDRLPDGRLLFHEPIALAAQLHTTENPQDDLGILESILGFYRLIYRENPVAESNISILKTLTGGNQHQVVVFPDDHPDLNAQGRLLDRWGNPYFFHALSATQMDIWSAGEDGKFNTGDDVKLGETNPNLQLNPGETDQGEDAEG